MLLLLRQFGSALAELQKVISGVAFNVARGRGSESAVLLSTGKRKYLTLFRATIRALSHTEGPRGAGLFAFGVSMMCRFRTRVS